MRKFKVTFTTSADLLPTVVSLLTKEVGSLSVEEVNCSPAANAANGTPPRIVNRESKPASEWRTGKLLLKSLIDGPKSRHALIDIFVADGMAATSMASTGTRLIRQGLVGRMVTGEYYLLAPKNS
jgi:hypothetical protein